MMTVRNLEYCICGRAYLVNDIILFLYLVIIIGFNPATYTVAESAGTVNVTVNVLNGTLGRDMHVLLMTSLTDSTATGTWFL